ncbi:MAG: hypothetical protein A2762_03865 [Candidatus Lloydbacteria bacterium RIFCSPHIGHO2_01_FULL_54_11]|nr:MAG: hypothetical protein A2762_03865 [Candidatus Lloydbacteria bacterium RIFCSPHIGHO2_01_FULL_54_11]
MKRRRLVMLVTAVAGALVFGFGLAVYTGLAGWEHAERRLTDEAKGRVEVERKKNFSAKEAIANAANARTPEAWDQAMAAIDALEDRQEKAVLKSAITLERVDAYGRARDQLLERAVELARYNENDPRILEFIERAKPLQAEIVKMLENPDQLARELPSGMSDEERKAWNATLWYHVGHANYSQLWFTPSENKTEINKLIQKSLGSYARVFAFIPKDTRTEYAIEALYEVNKTKNRDGDAQGKGKPKRPILLPRNEQAPTSGPGTTDPGI